MSPRQEKTATELMQQYWAACRSRRELPRKVYGLVALAEQREHPSGYVIAWGVGRKYVETQHEKRGDADKWAIQEFEPT